MRLVRSANVGPTLGGASVAAFSGRAVMPRKLSYFIAAAALALAVPAAAATLSASAGPSSSFANQACDGPGGPFTGSTTQTITRTCTRSDIGDATGKATAS